jgi:hypothetical protein
MAMTIKSLVLITMSAAFLYACDDAPESDETIEEITVIEDDEILDKIDESDDAIEPETAASIVGVYKNGDGGKLTISDLRTENGKQRFEYHFVSESSNEDCAGIDYTGSATFDGKQTGKVTNEYESLVAFTFAKAYDSVNFEPEMSMIGMDCARVMDTKFVKK